MHNSASAKCVAAEEEKDFSEVDVRAIKATGVHAKLGRCDLTKEGGTLSGFC